jgi:hypothetical protein
MEAAVFHLRNRVRTPVSGHPPHTTNGLTPPPSSSSRLPPQQNHPRSPAGNSAERSVVSLVTRPWQIPELAWSYVAALGGVINTTDVIPWATMLPNPADWVDFSRCQG